MNRHSKPRKISELARYNSTQSDIVDDNVDNTHEIIVNPPLTVEVGDNHIYFYSAINSDRILALRKHLIDTDTFLRTEHVSRDLDAVNMPVTPIWLHINSDGGSIADAFAMVDFLRTIPSPVYSLSEGICASAATLLAMCCKKRYIYAYSLLLIHQLSGWSWGSYEKMRDDMRLSKLLMQQLYDFYDKYAIRTERDTIKQLLQRDTWINPMDALRLGMVDVIIDGEQKITFEDLSEDERRVDYEALFNVDNIE